MKQRPVAVGLLVCEKIIIEAETRNRTLVNCFHRRRVDSIPSEPISFIVFGGLTGGRGEMPITARLERLDTLEIVHEERGKVRFSNPLAEVQFRLTIPDVCFPVGGLYEIVVLLDNEFLASRRLLIVHSDPEESE